MESGLTADVIHNRKKFTSLIDKIKTSEEKPSKRRSKSVTSEEQRSEAKVCRGSGKRRRD